MIILLLSASYILKVMAQLSQSHIIRGSTGVAEFSSPLCIWWQQQHWNTDLLLCHSPTELQTFSSHPPWREPASQDVRENPTGSCANPLWQCPMTHDLSWVLTIAWRQNLSRIVVATILEKMAATRSPDVRSPPPWASSPECNPPQPRVSLTHSTKAPDLETRRSQKLLPSHDGLGAHHKTQCWL